ncbi:MAG: UDP-N-acetylglucosamine 2-epimerase (non-hydrolyzing) [bacterium]
MDKQKGKLKICSVFGTRPEAIKMAPVVLEAMKRESCEHRLIVTGQHRKMLDQMLELFGLKPDYDLNIMLERQTLTQITTRALEGMAEALADAKPDVLLVHGDTTTSFVGALAGYYAQIPVGHVEAGLRTGERYNPYPEEMNRRLTDAIADIYFAPTVSAREQLLRENIEEHRIFVTGNSVIDALLMVTERPEPDGLIPDVPKDAPVLLVEAHRRENLGEPMSRICLGLKDLVQKHKKLHIVFPVHLNPAVRDTVFGILDGEPRVHLLPPQDYLPFVMLMKRAKIILTDSGGIQEEAPSLKRPVLVLRTVTERPEAVAAGAAILVGPDRELIVETTSRLLTDEAFYAEATSVSNPYGDGLAARRTVDALSYFFKRSSAPPKEFEF